MITTSLVEATADRSNSLLPGDIQIANALVSDIINILEDNAAINPVPDEVTWILVDCYSYNHVNNT